MSNNNDTQWRYAASEDKGGPNSESLSAVPSNIVGFITYVQRLAVIERGHELSTDALGLAVRVRLWAIALKETLGYEGLIFSLILFPIYVAMASGFIPLFGDPDAYKTWFTQLFIHVFTFTLNAFFTLVYIWLYKSYVIGPATKMVVSTIIHARFVGSVLKILLILLVFFGLKETLSTEPVQEFLYTAIQTYINPTIEWETLLQGLELYKESLQAALPKILLLVGMFATLPYVPMLLKKANEEKKFDTELQIKPNLTHIGKGQRLDKLNHLEPAEDIFLEFKERHVHEGTVGTTNTGKTVLARAKIISDIHNGYSVLVIDPKGDKDLKLAIFEAARETNRLDDFIYISPLFPNLSEKINPFANFIMIEEVVSHLVAPIITDEPFFRNIAEEFARILVKALHYLEQKGEGNFKLTLAQIADFCSYEGLKTLREQHLKQYEESEEMHMVIASIDRILGTPPDYFNKVAGNLRTVLTSLTVGSFAEIISHTTTNRFVERLESGKPVIMYVETASMLDDKTSSSFARIIGAMVQTLAGRMLLHHRKVLDPPLMVHIDEAFKAIYYGIENLFDKGRAANVCLSVYFQSISQFEQVLGQKTTRAILDNINTWTVLRLPSEESAQFFSKLSGEQMKFFINFHLDGTVGAMSRESTIVSPEEILSLPNRFFYLFRMTRGELWYGKTPTVKMWTKEEEEQLYREFVSFQEKKIAALYNRKEDPMSTTVSMNETDEP